MQNPPSLLKQIPNTGGQNYSDSDYYIPGGVFIIPSTPFFSSCTILKGGGILLPQSLLYSFPS